MLPKNVIDLTGQRFARLTAKKYIPDIKKWLCVCECGRYTAVAAGELKRSGIRSCGCLVADSALKRVPVIDLAGKRFGRLQVIAWIAGNKWKCVCDCGVVKPVNGRCLREGDALSCGCFHRERVGDKFRTHGRSQEQGAHSWYNMMRRCYTPEELAYKHYGGRGISVCDRWRESISDFLDDMGPMPSPEYTVERKDVNGNYEPLNCVWATRKTQARNTRRTIYIEFKGERKPLTQWTEEKGFPYHLIRTRLKHGWTVEQALTLPLHSRP